MDEQTVGYYFVTQFNLLRAVENNVFFFFVIKRSFNNNGYKL